MRALYEVRFVHKLWYAVDCWLCDSRGRAWSSDVGKFVKRSLGKVQAFRLGVGQGTCFSYPLDMMTKPDLPAGLYAIRFFDDHAKQWYSVTFAVTWTRRGLRTNSGPPQRVRYRDFSVSMPPVVLKQVPRRPLDQTGRPGRAIEFDEGPP